MGYFFLSPLFGVLYSYSFLTTRQNSNFDGFSVVKALVPESHRRWDNVVLRPFSQSLIVETKSLLYKFCTLVSATLQYNRVFHVFLYLLKPGTAVLAED